MKLFRPKMIAALALLTVGAAPAADPDELALDISAPYVTVTLNGARLKLRVDFDAPTNLAMILNPGAAKRAHVWTTVGITAKTCLPEEVKYVGGQATLAFGQKLSSLRKAIGIRWMDHDVVDDADGVISPLRLLENRVTMRLHKPVAGERTIEIPIKSMQYEFGPHAFLSNYVRVGGKVVAISYAPQQPYNIATGAAGAYFAAERDGRWSGDPLTMKLRAGARRPGNPMTLGRGLSLSGLPLRSFLVDTKYLKGDYQLPDGRPRGPEPDEAVDPGAITVTGKKIKPPAGEWSALCTSIELVLGQETLGGCSSISHDKKRAMLTLQCL